MTLHSFNNGRKAKQKGTRMSTETVQQTQEEHEPQASGVLKGIRKEGDEVLATIIMPHNSENIGTIGDLGYEITDDDEIEFELVIPEHEELGFSNFGDYLTSKALWVIGTKSEYIPKRELSKILIEFMANIEDGRPEAA